MDKESLEPDKTHHRSLQGAQPAPSGTLRATRVFYGWDEYSLLVLSIILTGTIPLAITSGIAIGAIFWNWNAVPEWGATLIGVVVVVLMFGVQFLTLYVLTRSPVRNRFIPLARSLFPREP